MKNIPSETFSIVKKVDFRDQKIFNKKSKDWHTKDWHISWIESTQEMCQFLVTHCVVINYYKPFKAHKIQGVKIHEESLEEKAEKQAKSLEEKVEKQAKSLEEKVEKQVKSLKEKVENQNGKLENILGLLESLTQKS